jgi:hypothetical protein
LVDLLIGHLHVLSVGQQLTDFMTAKAKQRRGLRWKIRSLI